MNTAVVLFTLGGLLETFSEIQRAIFKFNRDNSMFLSCLSSALILVFTEGKLYTGGLFRLCQHPNYLGYTMWRTGLAFLSGRYSLFLQLI